MIAACWDKVFSDITETSAANLVAEIGSDFLSMSDMFMVPFFILALHDKTWTNTVMAEA